jgi:hypothetical protein
MSCQDLLLQVRTLLSSTLSIT